MIERAISPASIQSMLQTLRSHEAQAANQPGAIDKSKEAQGTKAVGFNELVANAVGQVNQMQVQSRELQDAYSRGEDLPLTDVVLGMQKSSLAFEATLQIRNKVLKAYEDILNMPV
jgi:flagellar hook-basal body complex protein FliE